MSTGLIVATLILLGVGTVAGVVAAIQVAESKPVTERGPEAAQLAGVALVGAAALVSLYAALDWTSPLAAAVFTATVILLVIGGVGVVGYVWLAVRACKARKEQQGQK